MKTENKLLATLIILTISFAGLLLWNGIQTEFSIKQVVITEKFSRTTSVISADPPVSNFVEHYFFVFNDETMLQVCEEVYNSYFVGSAVQVKVASSPLDPHKNLGIRE